MKHLPATLILTTALTATPAAAHQFWLEPSTYVSAPGAVVEVGALAGTGFRGDRIPWVPAHCVRFVACGAKAVDLTPAASMGDLAWARFAPSDGGGTMLAFESSFTPIEIPAAKFDAYLAEEGLTGPAEARRRATAGAAGRERYRRCAKVWLSGVDASRAERPVELPLEIVPRSQPGLDPELPLVVLWDGRPLAGALVRAWVVPLAAGGQPTDGEERDSVGVAWQGRTDARGRATVPVSSRGEWIVSVVHMVPSRAPRDADWESTWASLTFRSTARSRQSL